MSALIHRLGMESYKQMTDLIASIKKNNIKNQLTIKIIFECYYSKFSYIFKLYCGYQTFGRNYNCLSVFVLNACFNPITHLSVNSFKHSKIFRREKYQLRATITCSSLLLLQLSVFSSFISHIYQREIRMISLNLTISKEGMIVLVF